MRTLLVLCSLFVVIYAGSLSSSSLSMRGKDRPRSVTVEPLNGTALIVRWQHPRTRKSCPVSRYIIRIKNDVITGSERDRVLGNKTHAVIGDLLPDTQYQVRIVAKSCRGKSPPSKWVNARTLEMDGGSSDQGHRAIKNEYRMPGEPSSVRTRTMVDSIILIWEPPDDNVLVRGYMVGYGEGVPDVNWQYVDANTRNFTIRSLKPATQYVISLRAFNNFGKGPVVYDLVYTREDHAPTVGPLSAPIGLRSRILSPRTVWLKWTDPSLGRTQKVIDDRYYIISYAQQPRGLVHTHTTKTLNVVLYNLVPAVTYEFRVKARKSAEETPFSISVYNTTFEDAPGSAPRAFRVQPSNSSDTSVRVSWLPPLKPNGRITGYLVYYAETREFAEWTIEGVLGDIFSIEIRGLDDRATYDFKIQARNAKGYSPMSEIITFSMASRHMPRIVVPTLPTTTTSTMFPPPPRINIDLGPRRGSDRDLDRYDQGSAADGDDDTEYEPDEEQREEPIQSDERKEEETDDNNNNNNNNKKNNNVYYQPMPLKQIAEPDLAYLRAAPPNDNSKKQEDAEEASQLTVRTLVRHSVSAVVTWTEDEASQRRAADEERVYELSYYLEGSEDKIVLMSDTPLFLLQNLDADSIYRYDISSTVINKKDTLPKKLGSGTLDTSQYS